MRDRRTILATAGAVALTLVAGGAAIAANLGVLGSTGDGEAGKLSPLDEVSVTNAPPATGPKVETVYVDEYVNDGSTGAAEARGAYSPPRAAAPVVSSAPVSTPAISDDSADEYEIDEPDEVELDEPDEVEFEEPEVEEPEHLEGADDDD